MTARTTPPRADRRPRVGEVIGSLAFYLAFFPLSLAFLGLALLALTISGRSLFERVTLVWSRYHRACLRWCAGIRIEVRGTAPGAGVLVAIKHQSMFEALDLPCLFGNPAAFAKAELLSIPLWGRMAKAYGVIPIERAQGAAALRAMLSAARERSAAGRLLVIFPEGTRVPPGSTPPLRSGFAGLYKLLRVPVVPVALNSGCTYAGLWKRRGTIEIVFGAPILPGLARAEIEQRVHAAINALEQPGCLT